jgi:hypothetical protein
MRRIATTLVALAAAAGVTGCGSGSGATTPASTQTATTTPTVVTTETSSTPAAPTKLSPAAVTQALAPANLHPKAMTAANRAHGLQADLVNASTTIAVAVYGTAAEASAGALRVTTAQDDQQLLAEGYKVRRFENVLVIALAPGPILAAVRGAS